MIYTFSNSLDTFTLKHKSIYILAVMIKYYSVTGFPAL